MLKNLLRSHPKVISFGELLNPSKLLWDYGDFNELYNTEAVHELRRTNPAELMNLVYNTANGTDAEAVGFKSLYNHYDLSKGFPQVLEYLLNDSSIKVIHNKRANIFKTFCSYRVAAKRTELGKTMNAYQPDEVERAITVRIDPAACLKFIKKTLVEEKKFDTLFASRDSIDVIYEDLASRTGLEMKRVLKFLDVEYAPLRQTTFKVRQNPIEEVVENYDEVRAVLEKEGYGHFFEAAD
jgi:hypothetical protein